MNTFTIATRMPKEVRPPQNAVIFTMALSIRRTSLACVYLAFDTLILLVQLVQPLDDNAEPLIHPDEEFITCFRVEGCHLPLHGSSEAASRLSRPTA